MICPEPGPLEPAITRSVFTGLTLIADSAAPLGLETRTSPLKNFSTQNSFSGTPPRSVRTRYLPSESSAPA